MPCAVGNRAKKENAVVAADALASTPFFTDFPSEAHELLSPLAFRKTYGAGDVIFRQDDPATVFGVFIKGLISFRARLADGEVSITIGHARHPGDVFGWSSVIGTAHTYTHTAVCIEECEVIEIDGPGLLQVCREHPRIGVPMLEKLSAVISERLASTRAQVGNRIRRGLISHG